MEAQPHRANLDGVGDVVLAQVERVVDQVVVAPRPYHASEHVARTGGGVQHGPRGAVGARPALHRHRLLARRIGQRVGERHEVEEVIGVHVRDHHRIDVAVVAKAAQLGEDAVAAVHQQRDAVLLDQVAAAGTVGVLPGRTLSKHCDAHREPSLPLLGLYSR